MGTWGTGIFEDDTACDFADDMMSSTNIINDLRSTLEKGMNDGYLEAPEGTEITVAAALVDGLANGRQWPYADGALNEWLRANSHLDASSLKPLALKALKNVLGEESELHELWQENEEEYPVWRQNVEALTKNLQ